MRKQLNILKIALLLGGAFFLFPSNTFSQEIIELLEGAEDIKLDGKSNWIVTGNVVFKSGDNYLYCDSAYFQTEENKVRAYKNVHFSKQDTLNMFCDSLHYDMQLEYVKLFGNVRVRDNEYRLTTDSLDYDFKNDIGVYRNGGLITSITTSDSLSSRIGYFYPNSERFNFSDSVVYKSEEYIILTDTLQFNSFNKTVDFFGPTYIQGDELDMYCEKGWYDLDNDKGILQINAYANKPEFSISADSLYYSSKDSLYIAKYKVSIVDTTNKVSFHGDYAINDDVEKYSFITGHTLAKRFEDKDTLYIHADTLYNYLDSVRNPELMLAYYDVKIFRNDLQGICDSLSYNRKIGEMNLYNDPILWAKNAQLTGDSITVFEEKDEIKRAFLRKKGLVVTNVDSTNYYNQVSGTFMNAYFDSTQIRRVDIDGNAKTVYFLEEENENDSTIVVERKGMNRLYASTISLRFEDGDIESATYRDNPDGVLYPMNQINEKEERVEDFRWDEEKRPKSWKQLPYSEEEQSFVQTILTYLIKLSVLPYWND